MKRLIASLVVATIFIVASLTSRAFADVEAGKKVFEAQCARCHGAEGKGDGPDSMRVPVRPRDLTSGLFKFRTTASGTAPSDEDLHRTISRGLAGSGMPSFANLNEESKKNVIAYIKTFSTVFGPGETQPIPPPDERIKASFAKGKEVYDTLQCALCHGPAGRANGTSAFTLKDAWQHPIKAADLQQGWTYRAGSAPKDIYYRLMAGLDGAPMPSYKEAVSADDAWQLANYVAAMQLKTNWDFKIQAHKVAGALPTTFADAAWDQAPRTDVNVQGSVFAGDVRQFSSINAISVQALFNDKEIAFRLFWDDPTEGRGNPADSVLVAFKPQDYAGDTRGNLHNLYFPNAPALDLAIWSAAEAGKVRQGISNLYDATRGGWNPPQSYAAAAEYADGRWTLVFSRPLVDASAEAERPLSMGFAVWDGNNGEAGLKRGASQWITVSMGETQPHH